MCGICGIVSFNNNTPVVESDIAKMESSMSNRGPDDSGRYLNKKRNIGLGFRRLSIIDLKDGAQPMKNSQKDIWLVFNGEIYNHKKLRKVLENRGHIFRTNCDTEAIVNGYAEWGHDVVKKLRGMFSFAIWDNDDKILFLARDRLGIKPLYYYYDDKNFIFSST